jgi:hypothetical protein
MAFVGHDSTQEPQPVQFSLSTVIHPVSSFFTMAPVGHASMHE